MAVLQLQIQLTKDRPTIHNIDYEDIAVTSMSKEVEASGYRHILIGMKPIQGEEAGRTIECPVSKDQDIDEVYNEMLLAIKNRDRNEAFMFPYDPRA